MPRMDGAPAKSITTLDPKPCRRASMACCAPRPMASMVMTEATPIKMPKTESALRIFGADRALLLVEGVALAKLIMLAVAYPFRRRR